MTIGMLLPGSKPIYGEITMKEPLGGTETYGIHMAEELAKSNRMYIFGDTYNHEFNGVTYVNICEYSKYAGLLDTLILSGSCGGHIDILSDVDTYSDIPNLMMWVHGAGIGGVSNPPESIYDIVDTIVYLSEWHRMSYNNEMMRVAGIDMNRCHAKGKVVTGFVPDRYAIRLPLEDRGDYVVYASVPTRGLSAFTRILPKLKVACPTLEVRSYSSFTTYSRAWDGEAAIVDSLEANPNYRYYSPVPFIDIIDVIAHARAVVYPSLFRETMCYIATMAMRTGTPMVTSNLAALSETATHSPYLIDVPDSNDNELIAYVSGDEYAAEFTRRVSELYHDSDKWEDESKRCYDSSTEFNISSCARKFIGGTDESE